MTRTTYSYTIKEILNSKAIEKECPIPLSAIPNTMGINLVAVDRLRWIRRSDGQLESLEIEFLPT